MVFVDVKLLEDLLEALLGEELFLVDADHHELVKGDQTVTRAVCHRDHVVNPLLVEIRPEMLPVPIDQLYSRQRPVTTRVKIRKHLLELDSIVHVQEVLDEVAQSRLLGRIFRAEGAQVSQCPCNVLIALVDRSTVIFFLQATSHFEPGVLESV